MSDAAFTVYAGFFGLILLVCGVALAKSAFPPPDLHQFPDGDPNEPSYCVGCAHTHPRGSMEWNENQQFRCIDCCSEEAMNRADLEISLAHIAMRRDPAYRAAQEAETLRQIRAEEAAYRAAFPLDDDDQRAYCTRCGRPHEEGRCGRP